MTHHNQTAHQFSQAQISKMQEIVEPLRPFGIEYFAYNRFVNHNEYMVLCPLYSSIRDRLGFSYDAEFSVGPQLQKIYSNCKISLWDSFSSDNSLLQHLKTEEELKHGVALFRKIDHGVCEAFHFASNHENDKILDFYINNMDLLNHFADYFTDKMSTIVDHRVPGKLIQLDKTIQLPGVCQDDQDRNELKDNFLEKTQITRKTLFLNGHKIILSSPQYDCLKLIQQGFCSKEIAQLMRKSPRTIEDYTKTLLDKLNLEAKRQIIHLKLDH